MFATLPCNSVRLQSSKANFCLPCLWMSVETGNKSLWRQTLTQVEGLCKIGCGLRPIYANITVVELSAQNSSSSLALAFLLTSLCMKASSEAFLKTPSHRRLLLCFLLASGLKHQVTVRRCSRNSVPFIELIAVCMAHPELLKPSFRRSKWPKILHLHC